MEKYIIEKLRLGDEQAFRYIYTIAITFFFVVLHINCWMTLL